MIFSDVLEDIKKLIDLPLESIRPGAGICIKSIDENKGNLSLVNSRGEKKTRPISELKQIWESLQTKQAIRVDEVLHGSGSSRNQPETIFANLPYVEHVKVRNKKHIIFVQNKTHAYGTLKELDSEKMDSLLKELEVSNTNAKNEVCIVTENLTETIAQLRNAVHFKKRAIKEGFYQLITSNDVIFLISSSYTQLPIGVYPILSAARYDSYFPIEIGSEVFYYLKISNSGVLLKK